MNVIRGNRYPRKEATPYMVLGILMRGNPAVAINDHYALSLISLMPLYSMEGFKEITRGHLAESRWPHRHLYSDAQIARIAATLFPITKDVAEFCRTLVAVPAKFSVAPDEAAHLIISGGLGVLHE